MKCTPETCRFHLSMNTLREKMTEFVQMERESKTRFSYQSERLQIAERFVINFQDKCCTWFLTCFCVNRKYRFEICEKDNGTSVWIAQRIGRYARNVRVKWKFSGRPSEILYFFRCNRLGNYHSICTKFPFLLFANLLALTPTSCAITIYQWGWKFFTRMENFRNFKPRILAKWKAPQIRVCPPICHNGPFRRCHTKLRFLVLFIKTKINLHESICRTELS